MNKTVITVFALGLLFMCSCMSDKEYQLRKQDIEAKKAYPATYQPLVLNGPLTLNEGASIVSTTPSQPFQPADIPNGQAIQAGVIKDVSGLAALTGISAIGIHKANGDTSKTTINNNGGAAE